LPLGSSPHSKIFLKEWSCTPPGFSRFTPAFGKNLPYSWTIPSNKFLFEGTFAGCPAKRLCSHPSHYCGRVLPGALPTG